MCSVFCPTRPVPPGLQRASMLVVEGIERTWLHLLLLVSEQLALKFKFPRMREPRRNS